MADARLRQLLQGDHILVVPGSFDMISARLIDRLGFPAVILGGYGHTASHLGMADAGLITLPELAERAYNTVRSVSIPVIADGDTGFGGLVNVRRTVQEYEHAGASAIQIEDQQMPKKCGHTLGREVVEAEEMCLKIRVAVETRTNPDFLIFARTDARTTLGLGEAIRRGRMYREAGADAVFVESPESEDEFRRIGEELAGMPLIANMVVTGRGPLLSTRRLKEFGFKVVLYYYENTHEGDRVPPPQGQGEDRQGSSHEHARYRVSRLFDPHGGRPLPGGKPVHDRLARSGMHHPPA